METKDTTDYAAAYRQYCAYGRGRTVKQFCEEENYNYTKFRRYVDKALWSAGKSERDAIRHQFATVEVEKAPEEATQASTKEDSADQTGQKVISIYTIEIKVRNGLRFSVELPSLESLVEVLRKLVG